jgi:hypothetical protein
MCNGDQVEAIAGTVAEMPTNQCNHDAGKGGDPRYTTHMGTIAPISEISN